MTLTSVTSEGSGAAVSGTFMAAFISGADLTGSLGHSCLWKKHLEQQYEWLLRPLKLWKVCWKGTFKSGFSVGPQQVLEQQWQEPLWPSLAFLEWPWQDFWAQSSWESELCGHDWNLWCSRDTDLWDTDGNSRNLWCGSARNLTGSSGKWWVTLVQCLTNLTNLGK